MKIAFEIYQIYSPLWLMEVLVFCAWESVHCLHQNCWKLLHLGFTSSNEHLNDMKMFFMFSKWINWKPFKLRRFQFLSPKVNFQHSGYILGLIMLLFEFWWQTFSKYSYQFFIPIDSMCNRIELIKNNLFCGEFSIKSLIKRGLVRAILLTYHQAMFESVL